MTNLDWAQTFDNIWMPIRDGNMHGRAMYERHYSCRHVKDGRRTKLFVGPGQKLCPSLGALFVWRKFIDRSGQVGVNCAIFRNENAFDGAIKSSELILAAETLAWTRWPRQRLYTYVNPRRIRSRNPGYCFKMAGWRVCGITKINKLLILEKYPT